MAQKVTIVLVDDIDGGEATQTVSFGLDGTSYEIDLNDDNAELLREAIAPFVGHARKVTGAPAKRGGSKKSAASNDGPTPKEIRAWAIANGHELSERGRVPEEIRAAYEAAH
ncbi:histone-like nucleoid-structuring protein Lsr2 [Nocardioides yefusunii]|uniref:Lsr2 family protein n=1 Tax=Nocardioides yefusunii TaxID=2500546 RepID=A0ABW1R1L0_9ACTN|nr:Lsr2 family protein [Nocardioides yefusunii]